MWIRNAYSGTSESMSTVEYKILTRFGERRGDAWNIPDGKHYDVG